MDTTVPAGTPAHLFDPSYASTGRCVVCLQPKTHPIHIQKEQT